MFFEIEFAYMHIFLYLCSEIMLSHLHIRNYALISHLDIDFREGFSVMTGETGAGKSILLGALSLLLGAKNEGAAIKDNTRNCKVEGTFDLTGLNL